MYPKSRSHSINVRILNRRREQQRLIFPGPENEEGYVGRKHFNERNKDSVILQSPEGQRFQRFDKLKTQQLQGAFPNIKSQAVQNLQHFRKRNQSQSLKRLKTEEPTTIDSLDLLVKNRGKGSNENREKDKLKTEQNQQQIRENKSYNLSKEHILGFYNDESWKKADPPKAKRFLNPTYLSSLKPFCW